MKSYYIIAFDANNAERYIDNQHTNQGTSFEDQARPFDTTEEAYDFIDYNELKNVWVKEFSIPSYNVKKSYTSSPSKNHIEVASVTLDEAIMSLDGSERLWTRHGGLVVERTEDTLVCEESDGSETITWYIEEAN